MRSHPRLGGMPDDPTVPLRPPAAPLLTHAHQASDDQPAGARGPGDQGQVPPTQPMPARAPVLPAPTLAQPAPPVSPPPASPASPPTLPTVPLPPPAVPSPPAAAKPPASPEKWSARVIMPGASAPGQKKATGPSAATAPLVRVEATRRFDVVARPAPRRPAPQPRTVARPAAPQAPSRAAILHRPDRAGPDPRRAGRIGLRRLQVGVRAESLPVAAEHGPEQGLLSRL